MNRVIPLKKIVINLIFIPLLLRSLLMSGGILKDDPYLIATKLKAKA